MDKIPRTAQFYMAILAVLRYVGRNLATPLLEQFQRLEDFVIILHFGCISEIHIATSMGSCQDWEDLVGVPCAHYLAIINTAWWGGKSSDMKRISGLAV
jgi:hypothetical protein